MPIQQAYFQPLSFSQASPYVTGMETGTNIAGQNMLNQLNAARVQNLGILNQYLPAQSQANLLASQLANRMNENTLQYQPDMLQAALTGQQLGNQGKAITNQYLPESLQAQIGLQGAQSGLLGTEAAKNQFLLNNPSFMVPGMAGQIAGLSWLQKNNPDIFQAGGQPQAQQTQDSATGAVQPTTNYSNATSLPGGVPFSPQALAGAMNQAPTPSVAPQANAASMPMMGAGSPAAQAGLNPNSLAGMMMNQMFLPYQKDMAQMNWYNSRSAPFNNLPPDMKNQTIAQGQAFGYTPDQAASMLMQGYSLSDLAQKAGYGTDQSAWPTPQYAPTGASRSLAQRRGSANAELNSLSGQLNSALAPYSQRIAGYSPKQIAQAISGDDPDAQARFLAAKALQPELAAIRMKVQNGQVGVEGIREMQNAAMANFKAFQPLVTPDVYSKSNQYMDKWLNDAVGSANKTILSPKEQQTLGQAQTQSPMNSGAQQTASIGGKSYVKINGSWYPQ